MGAPCLTFSVSAKKVCPVSGHDAAVVTFSADAPYQAFECRATRSGDAWGLGIGELVAAFSGTPANTQRTFEVYDDHLCQGDGEYRLTLYVQGLDGSWNDTIVFIPSDTDEVMLTADGMEYLCRKGAT